MSIRGSEREREQNGLRLRVSRRNLPEHEKIKRPKERETARERETLIQDVVGFST